MQIVNKYKNKNKNKNIIANKTPFKQIKSTLKLRMEKQVNGRKRYWCPLDGKVSKIKCQKSIDTSFKGWTKLETVHKQLTDYHCKQNFNQIPVKYWSKYAKRY